MKHRKRSRVQIILEILALLSEGDCTKTDIVYGLHLNFRAATRYLQKLVESGFIVWNEHTCLWHITDDGVDALHILRKSLRAIEAVL